jgi:hypothetical protein
VVSPNENAIVELVVKLVVERFECFVEISLPRAMMSRLRFIHVRHGFFRLQNRLTSRAGWGHLPQSGLSGRCFFQYAGLVEFDVVNSIDAQFATKRLITRWKKLSMVLTENRE